MEEKSTVKFYKALLEFQSDIEGMKKDEKNPFYKSSYLPLPNMLRELKPLAQKHGFILSQPTKVIQTASGVLNVATSKLTHAETGLSEVSEIAITPELLSKADMQKLGGAITYGRRYTLSALVSLEEFDDDGNLASGKTKNKATPAPTKTTPAATVAKKSGFRKPKTTPAPAVQSSGDDW